MNGGKEMTASSVPITRLQIGHTVAPRIKSAILIPLKVTWLIDFTLNSLQLLLRI
jgi:hypothetical protein